MDLRGAGSARDKDTHAHADTGSFAAHLYMHQHAYINMKSFRVMYTWMHRHTNTLCSHLQLVTNIHA